MTMTVKRSAGDARTFQTIPNDQLSDDLKGDDLLWIDVVQPDDTDVAVLREQLELPPLILEDLPQTHRSPTIRHYGDNLFIVFYALECPDDDISRFGVSIFVTDRYLISIRLDVSNILDDVADRWKQDVTDIGQRTPITLLYSMLDSMVDSYYPVLDRIADRVEDIEDRILGSNTDGIQSQIVQLRRSLLITRRILAGERDALVKVFRNDHPMINTELLPYFQDVYDHVNRATEALDADREMLSSTMDAYLSSVSNELNVVVRRLTSWTIILMVVTLVASIYGMNFVNMPELGWRLGYPYALALMAVLLGGMWITFRRIRWL